MLSTPWKWDYCRMTNTPSKMAAMKTEKLDSTCELPNVLQFLHYLNLQYPPSGT